MEKIKDQLTELSGCLKNYAKVIYDQLQTGLNEKEVVEKFEKVGVFNSCLNDLFMWKNGTRDDADEFVGKYDICTHGRLIPLDDAIEYFHIYTKEGLWVKEMFPVISNYAGDFVLIDINKTSPTFEALLLYSPDLLAITPQPIYDNLSSFIETIIECFTNGIYRYNEEEHFLEVNYDGESEVSLKKNPNSEWWKQ